MFSNHLFLFIQRSFSGELYFPSSTECCGSVTPTRQVTIPTKFPSVIDYKSVLKSTLRGKALGVRLVMISYYFVHMQEETDD